MKVTGELYCYHCGYLAAQVVGEQGTAMTRGKLIAATIGPGVRRGPDRSLRCGRCGGPLYLDLIEVRHERSTADRPEGVEDTRPRRSGNVPVHQ